MIKKYVIKVDNQYEIDVKDSAINDLDVLSKGTDAFQIIEEDQTFNIEVLDAKFDAKNYQISVNGNKYNVEIKDELDLLINKLGLTVGANKKEKDVKAPMPGLILDIVVSEGQEVKEGDSLLILEAMKMENMIVANADAVVKTIHVKKTDAVEKKQLLIEME